jgi:cell division protein FtsQ
MNSIGGVRPAIIQPAERYWRRRANRRVRKARMTRLLGRAVLALAALAVLSVGLYRAGAGTVERLRHAPALAVAHIEVLETRRADAEALRRRLDAWRGRNLVELDLSAVAAAATREPWVQEASVKRVLPDTLRVNVIERSPCAIAVIGGLSHVIDVAGHVIGPSGPGLADDLPVLLGLDPLSGDALVAGLRRGAQAVQRLRAAAGPWAEAISDLDLSAPDRIALRTVDPGPVILLDPQEVERNLARYLDLRGEIERRAGPLAQVDLRWQDRISALPAPHDDDRTSREGA